MPGLFLAWGLFRAALRWNRDSIVEQTHDAFVVACRCGVAPSAVLLIVRRRPSAILAVFGDGCSCGLACRLAIEPRFIRRRYGDID
jgi:hypothetical protein